ncbi:hypothetical protein NL676_021052 [Syzygium grande]|nr:hypothetical protein NL676_021052 [Syzygium grande]
MTREKSDIVDDSLPKHAKKIRPEIRIRSPSQRLQVVQSHRRGVLLSRSCAELYSSACTDVLVVSSVTDRRIARCLQ